MSIDLFYLLFFFIGKKKMIPTTMALYKKLSVLYSNQIFSVSHTHDDDAADDMRWDASIDDEYIQSANKHVCVTLLS